MLRRKLGDIPNLIIDNNPAIVWLVVLENGLRRNQPGVLHRVQELRLAGRTFRDCHTVFATQLCSTEAGVSR